VIWPVARAQFTNGRWRLTVWFGDSLQDTYGPSELSCWVDVGLDAAVVPCIRETESFVYFVRGAKCVKIGVTTNPGNRVRVLQASSPVPLRVIAMSPFGAALAVERRLHQRYRKEHSHFEWYYVTGNLAELCRQLETETPENIRDLIYEAAYEVV
jgi:hypothetical protein